MVLETAVFHLEIRRACVSSSSVVLIMWRLFCSCTPGELIHSW